MQEYVYKVCTAEAWSEAVRLGQFTGSAHDERDGFIHLSTKSQVAGTLARHFSDPGGKGHPGLVLVVVDPSNLGAALRWEPARDGSLFPHLYEPLDVRLAERVSPLAVDQSGRHLIPGDL